MTYKKPRVWTAWAMFNRHTGDILDEISFDRNSLTRFFIIDDDGNRISKLEQVEVRLASKRRKK